MFFLGYFSGVLSVLTAVGLTALAVRLIYSDSSTKNTIVSKKHTKKQSPQNGRQPKVNDDEKAYMMEQEKELESIDS